MIALLRARNIVNNLSGALGSSALVPARLGKATEAMNRLREAEQLLERVAASGQVGSLGAVYYWLGRTRLLLGLDGAQGLAERALTSSPHQPGFAALALQLLGDLAARPDRFDVERGEAYYRQALTLAEPRGMRPLVAHCHRGLGKLYRHIGERERAHECLAAAATMYRDMRMKFWLDDVQAHLQVAVNLLAQ
jgi:tetratricopeptide (TPR) repeat protein